jgi:hypothetical protein
MHTELAERSCPPAADGHAWVKARDVREGILRHVIAGLAPQFDKDPTHLPLANGMAMHAVLSLLPEEEAGWFSAADIVSLSLTASDLLKDAATVDMPPAMKLRYVGRAIQASKEARAIEATMQKRRKEREAMHPERIRRIRDPLDLARTQPSPAYDAKSEAAFAPIEAEILSRLDERYIKPAQADPEGTAAAQAAAETLDTAADEAEATLGPPANAPQAVASHAQPDEAPRPHLTSVTSPGGPVSVEELSTIAPWLTAKGPDGQPVDAGAYLAAEFKRQFQQLKPLKPHRQAYTGGKRRTG